MQIDDSKRARGALKTYFARNAIPTADQFAQLIDSGLNQREDGIVKVAGDALSIEAAGDDASPKRAIDFYLSFADARPAWSIALKPSTNPLMPGTGRLGWSIVDSFGTPHLAIDGATGNVGIGTAQPAEMLDVTGRVRAGALSIGAWPPSAANYVFFGTNKLDQTLQGNYALLQDAGGQGNTYLNSPTSVLVRLNNVDQMVFRASGIDTYAPLRVGGTLVPSAGNGAGAGIQFPADPGGGGGDLAWIRWYARSAESCNLEIGTSNDADDHISLMPSGNVGIGTLYPGAKLEVAGDLIVRGNIRYTGSLTQFSDPVFHPFPIGGVIGHFPTVSSAALKKDVSPIPSEQAAAIVGGLDPVSYRWKEGDQATQLGFIAENSPAAVTTPQRDAVYMNHITAALTRVVRDLSDTVRELTQRIAVLEATAR